MNLSSWVILRNRASTVAIAVQPGIRRRLAAAPWERVMPSVLVVEDSPMDRHLAAGLLRKSPDYTVFEAVDGKDALAKLELHLPDVVVTDMMMPNMNGLELVAAVKEQFPLMPIILMTSLGSEE